MNEKKKLVIVISRGFDDERSSVAWSIANGALNAGLDLSIFLVSSGVDWVRKGAIDDVRPNPLDPPMKDMIQKVIDSGSSIAVCPPCAKVRGYSEADLIPGIRIVGSIAVHEQILAGAAALSF